MEELTEMKLESYSSAGKQITLELFLPSASGAHPVVLILHGTFGLLPQYRGDIVSFAEALAEKGMAAAMPHYLEVSGSTPGATVMKEIGTHHDEWRQACADCLAAIAADARFDAARIGLLGFSLGGNLAFSLALSPPAGAAPRAVADFFGPMLGLAGDWSRLPPVLICHGTADPVVDPGESAQLVAHLEAAGRVRGTDFFYEGYPGESHGFRGAALQASRDRTVKFFSGLLQE